MDNVTLISVHFILIKPVFSDHLSYVTLFQCSLGRSHKTRLTVYVLGHSRVLCILKRSLWPYILRLNIRIIRFTFTKGHVSYSRHFASIFFNFNQLSCNYKTILNQTSVEWYLGDPLSEFCETGLLTLKYLLLRYICLLLTGVVVVVIVW